MVGLQLGSNLATVDGSLVIMPKPAVKRGGITCVPLRNIAEVLGMEVTYVEEGSDHSGDAWEVEAAPTEADRLYVCHVLVRTGRLSGRFAVYKEPPHVVARVVRDLETSLGAYGWDWVLQVTKIRAGYFWSMVPCVRDEHNPAGPDSFWTNAWAVYGQRAGKWTQLVDGQDYPSAREWRKAGIPDSVVTLFGEALYDYDAQRIVYPPERRGQR